MAIVHDIMGNRQRLDGGAMFGNAPRAVWSRWFAPDEAGRIELACRALLVEESGRRVLLETGIGSFFEPRLRSRYGVVETEHVLLASLRARGVKDSDIDVVLLSHLHFDHAGGLLSAFDPGKPLKLLFPKARYVVGERAWERAQHPHPRDRASFIPELVSLLENSGRLSIVGRDASQHPLLGPAYELCETDGHTPGMLHATLHGAARSLFFCADLVPGAAWVHLPITMGYDRFPERLIDEKAQVFEHLLARGTFLFFTHDPKVAAGRLSRDDHGRYSLQESREHFGRGWDLNLAS